MSGQPAMHWRGVGARDLIHMDTYSWESLVNAASVEHVADILSAQGPVVTPPYRDLGDLVEAKHILERYSALRIAAVRAKLPGRPAVFLSGGIDSSQVAAELAIAGLDPVCVTIHATDHPAPDVACASAVTEALGLDHVLVGLTDSQICRLSRRAIGLLGVDGLYEIAAAVVLMAGYDAARDACPDGAVYTGFGTDVLFSGGHVPLAPPRTAAAESEVRTSIWQIVGKDFTADRLVPDFFERLIGPEGHDRLIRTWSTLAAWHATCRFGPEVLFGHSWHGPVDKLCLRDRVADLGVPDYSVWEPHDMMQESSGVFSAFAGLARSSIAEDPVSRTYGDPVQEDPARIAARQWLKSLTPPPTSSAPGPAPHEPPWSQQLRAPLLPLPTDQYYGLRFAATRLSQFLAMKTLGTGAFECGSHAHYYGRPTPEPPAV